jgi:phosphatidate cytidylyltransferase
VRRGTPPCLPQPTLKRLFLTRVLTAAILLAAFVAALFWLPHALFALLISAVIGLAGHEWARLCRLGAVPAAGYAAVCGVLCFLSSLLLVPEPWIFTLATVFWLLAAPARLAREPQPVPAGLEIAAGLLVLVPAGLAAILLEPVELLMILGLTWVADTGAYLTGRAFGRRKLAPAISPGKTWEGVAGGAVACVIYAIIWGFFEPELRARIQGLAWIPFLAAAMLLFTVSVIGDLLESALKRRAGAKDSGRLLPGHGGVLDRIDSATATLPVAVLLLQLLKAS